MNLYVNTKLLLSFIKLELEMKLKLQSITPILKLCARGYKTLPNVDLTKHENTKVGRNYRRLFHIWTSAQQGELLFPENGWPALGSSLEIKFHFVYSSKRGRIALMLAVKGRNEYFYVFKIIWWHRRGEYCYLYTYTCLTFHRVIVYDVVKKLNDWDNGNCLINY